MARIADADTLRARYGSPNARALDKVLTRLDRHCRRFLELSPFLLVGTSGPDGLPDVSPRGDHPGFVRVLDDTTLTLPDRPGNKRIDSMLNLIAHPRIALLVLVPGVDEALRIAGDAEIRDDEDLRAPHAVDGRPPETVLLIRVREAYLHCAKALMRAALWNPDSRVDRAALPSFGQMLKDHAGVPLESQEAMLARYARELY